MRLTFPSMVRSSVFALFGFSSLLFAAGPSVKFTLVSPENSSGIHQPGQKIVWQVEPVDDQEHTITSGSFTVKLAGAKLLTQGNLTFGEKPAFIEATLTEPGTVVAEVRAPLASGTTLQATGGAAVQPWKLKPSAPAPTDFDAFWKAKIDELAAVPENPVLEKGDSEKEGVDYWKITMDNIRGTHINGQLARPATGEKFPALLLVQYAGVYPLQKNWATDPAKEGWLVLNIIAHDLPIDKPKDFYTEKAGSELKNYTSIGNNDREQSYFLRMFLSCYRAADYLSKRPDWNGQVFVVSGASQGGLQSLVAAALHPKITALLAMVPAGCDNTGYLAERNPGWPYWKNHAPKENFEKAMETSKYFDGVNFAARIHCPVLIGMGLADVTSPASGVFTAYNQIKAPKELVVMPTAPHQNVQNTQAPYYKRASAWKAALVKGEPAPLQPNAAVAPQGN